MEDKLITAKDVSDILNIPLTTVYFYAQKGLIPSVKFGRQRRFKKSDVLAWVTRLNDRAMGGRS